MDSHKDCPYNRDFEIKKNIPSPLVGPAYRSGREGRMRGRSE